MLPVLNQAARRIVSFASSAHRSHLHLLSAAAAASKQQQQQQQQLRHPASLAASTHSSAASAQLLPRRCCQCTAGCLSCAPRALLPQLCAQCTASRQGSACGALLRQQCTRRTPGGSAVRGLHCCGSGAAVHSWPRPGAFWALLLDHLKSCENPTSSAAAGAGGGRCHVRTCLNGLLDDS